MRMHKRMSWNAFLAEWRTTESLYRQTMLAQRRTGLARRSAARLAVLDQLIADNLQAHVPDCNSWDNDFKGRMMFIIRYDGSRRQKLIDDLRRKVSSGSVIEIYGRRRRSKRPA